MKAKELRIGNLVSVVRKFGRGDYKTQIKKINIYYLQSLIRSDFDYINPIPLTEEWLLKLGFVSNPYDDVYEKGDMHVLCDKTKGHTYLWLIEYPHIKYVHQLQNLYHSLTGEELEIIID